MTADLSFDVLAQLAAGRSRADVPCPICGPDRRELRNRLRPVLRIWLSGNFASYCCARCNVTGHAKADAAPVVHRLPTPTKQVEEADADRTAKAIRLWVEARDIGGTVAERYLASRRLILPEGVSGRALRYHGNCPFGDTRHPCLLGLFVGIHDNEPRAVHRTALTGDGKKIDRRTMGPKRGCAIKLTADEDVTTGLHVAEGIETALAAMALGFSPMWAMGDANGIEALPVLAGVECLNVIVDNDESGRGQEVARAVSARWTAAGAEVRRIIPDELGEDFADIAKRRPLS